MSAPLSVQRMSERHPTTPGTTYLSLSAEKNFGKKGQSNKWTKHPSPALFSSLQTHTDDFACDRKTRVF